MRISADAMRRVSFGSVAFFPRNERCVTAGSSSNIRRASAGPIEVESMQRVGSLGHTFADKTADVVVSLNGMPVGVFLAT